MKCLKFCLLAAMLALLSMTATVKADAKANAAAALAQAYTESINDSKSISDTSAFLETAQNRYTALLNRYNAAVAAGKIGVKLRPNFVQWFATLHTDLTNATTDLTTAETLYLQESADLADAQSKYDDGDYVGSNTSSNQSLSEGNSCQSNIITANAIIIDDDDSMANLDRVLTGLGA
jgi:hypothetical protein